MQLINIQEVLLPLPSEETKSYSLDIGRIDAFGQDVYYATLVSLCSLCTHYERPTLLQNGVRWAANEMRKESVNGERTRILHPVHSAIRERNRKEVVFLDIVRFLQVFRTYKSIERLPQASDFLDILERCIDLHPVQQSKAMEIAHTQGMQRLINENAKLQEDLKTEKRKNKEKDAAIALRDGIISRLKEAGNTPSCEEVVGTSRCLK